jgi:hypothetical protein
MIAAKTVTSVNFSSCDLGVVGVTELSKFIPLMGSIQRIDVSGCDTRGDARAAAAATLLTAAVEASRRRLRAHQVMAFSGGAHDRLGVGCPYLIDLEVDVWGMIAECVCERHGHEAVCVRLVQAGQRQFEVLVEGLVSEGIPS